MSDRLKLLFGSLDTAVASKVREIIEQQWGKSLADLQDLSIGQFYERRLHDATICYQPTNRYVLWVQFRYAREPRRITFTIA